MDYLLFKDDDEYTQPEYKNLYKLNDYKKFINPLNKYIYINKEKYGIVRVHDFYVLTHIDTITDQPIKDTELPYRFSSCFTIKKINIKNYLIYDEQNNYIEKKNKFINKWQNIDIKNLEPALQDYGIQFHMKFIEDCINEIFNLWTLPEYKKMPYLIFYIKMVYYYDLQKIIIWASDLHGELYEQYKKYVNNPKSRNNIDNDDIDNIIQNNIKKNNKDWISTGMINQYNDNIKKIITMFDGDYKKKKTTLPNAQDLPVGHFISKNPRFYDPIKKSWYDDIRYLRNIDDLIENDVIIGYDDKSKTGIHAKFKLRLPIKNIKKVKDYRTIEKGAQCITKNKEFLKNIARKLEIPDKELNKNSSDDLCDKIRNKLIYMELKARQSNSKIKYYYFIYEKKPDV